LDIFNVKSYQEDIITSVADALQYISYYHPLDYVKAVEEAYNKEHGITPRGVVKKITDIMDVGDAQQSTNAAQRILVAEGLADYKAKSPQEIGKEIKALEAQMLEHAKNLEFEKAAELRDKVQSLQQQLLKS